ncbi:hypothetical protein [Delftia lacustris]
MSTPFKLEDIQYFGETEAKFADQEFGLFILESISSIGRKFSEADERELDAPVQRRRRKFWRPIPDVLVAERTGATQQSDISHL